MRHIFINRKKKKDKSITVLKIFLYFLVESLQLQILMESRAKKCVKTLKTGGSDIFARFTDSPFHQSTVLHMSFLLANKLLKST